MYVHASEPMWSNAGQRRKQRHQLHASYKGLLKRSDRRAAMCRQLLQFHVGESRAVWQSPIAATRLESPVWAELAGVGHRHFWEVGWSMAAAMGMGEEARAFIRA
jgi:hypothetical protein